MKLASQRVVTPDGVRPATIVVDDGRIAALEPYDSASDAEDLGDLVVLPGLVDTHVHVNEPGRTEWEGFESATRAAAAGGVTTLLDMPLNSIPATTTVAALHTKRDAARGRCHVDVGFLGGVVPGNADALGPLRRAGVLGFKCFLAPSGVPEFEHVDESDLRVALPIVRDSGVVLMAHAELVAPVPPSDDLDSRVYRTYLATRPVAFETNAVALLIDLAAESGARIHVVHLSAAESVPLLRAAHSLGAAITAETCPHYLALSAADVPDGATEFKCAPPIRDARHRDALWEALLDDTVQMIVSDHSPAPPDLKCRETGDFLAAWGGIASLQLSLRIVWTEMRRRGLSLDRLATWMGSRPAALVGLGATKGRIAPGCDADLVVFDPDDTGLVSAGMLLHRHPLTPYIGRTLAGTVRRTYLRGRLVYEDGAIVSAPSGALLSHPDAA